MVLTLLLFSTISLARADFSSSVAGKEGMDMYPRFSEHKSYFNYTLKPILAEPARANLDYWGVSDAVLKTLQDQRETII